MTAHDTIENLANLFMSASEGSVDIRILAAFREALVKTVSETDGLFEILCTDINTSLETNGPLLELFMLPPKIEIFKKIKKLCGDVVKHLI